jgi:hypothetical protein
MFFELRILFDVYNEARVDSQEAVAGAASLSTLYCPSRKTVEKPLAVSRQRLSGGAVWIDPRPVDASGKKASQ